MRRYGSSAAFCEKAGASRVDGAAEAPIKGIKHAGRGESASQGGKGLEGQPESATGPGGNTGRYSGLESNGGGV